MPRKPRDPNKPKPREKLRLTFIPITLDGETMLVALRGRSVVSVGTPGQVAVGIRPLLDEVYQEQVARAGNAEPEMPPEENVPPA